MCTNPKDPPLPLRTHPNLDLRFQCVLEHFKIKVMAIQNSLNMSPFVGRRAGVTFLLCQKMRKSGGNQDKYSNTDKQFSIKHSSPHPPKQCWTMWRPERSVLLARLASAGTRRKFRFVNIARGGGGGQHCSARLPKNGLMLCDSGLMRSIAFQNFKKNMKSRVEKLAFEIKISRPNS